jgi:hypothetical protein
MDDLRTHTRQFEFLHSAYTTSIYQKQMALSLSLPPTNREEKQKTGPEMCQKQKQRGKAIQKTRSHPTGGQAGRI